MKAQHAMLGEDTKEPKYPKDRSLVTSLEKRRLSLGSVQVLTFRLRHPTFFHISVPQNIQLLTDTGI